MSPRPAHDLHIKHISTPRNTLLDFRTFTLFIYYEKRLSHRHTLENDTKNIYENKSL